MYVHDVSVAVEVDGEWSANLLSLAQLHVVLHGISMLNAKSESNERHGTDYYSIDYGLFFMYIDMRDESPVDAVHDKDAKDLKRK